jgi:hypothetical protein
MPFTLSHAAVAAPLARRGLILSAIVAGSMAPDLAYFLQLSMSDRGSHEWPGLLTFSLPAGLAALWVFHRFLKCPLIALTPQAHRERLSAFAGPFAFAPWRQFLSVLASVLAGLASHLLLDAWTHREGIVVQHWPWLSTPLLDWPAYPLPVYDLMQAGLSVGLLLALVFQYWTWFRNATPAPAPLTAFLDVRPILLPLIVIGSIAAACGVAYAAASVPPVNDVLSFRIFCGRVILAGLSAFVAGLVILGRIRERTTPARVKEED